MGEVMDEALSTPFDLVLGRKTYETFAAHPLHASEQDGAKPRPGTGVLLGTYEPAGQIETGSVALG